LTEERLNPKVLAASLFGIPLSTAWRILVRKSSE